MFNMTNFKKNKADIGKGEVALVMFFGDCRFPEGNGDVEVTGDSNIKIELKVNNGVISDRFQSKELTSGWSDLKSVKVPSNNEVWKIMNLKSINTNNIVLKGDYKKELPTLVDIIK